MSAPSQQPSDRELRTSRLVAASPAQVLGAFTDPARLARWWGPAGFTNSFEVCEPRPGGAWRYVMHGPDGTDYRNQSTFRELGPERAVIEHVSAPRFVLTVALAPEQGGTRVDWTQAFETAEVCRKVAPFAVPGNEQNLDRLEAELRRS